MSKITMIKYLKSNQTHNPMMKKYGNILIKTISNLNILDLWSIKYAEKQNEDEVFAKLVWRNIEDVKSIDDYDKRELMDLILLAWNYADTCIYHNAWYESLQSQWINKKQWKFNQIFNYNNQKYRIKGCINENEVMLNNYILLDTLNNETFNNVEELYGWFDKQVIYDVFNLIDLTIKKLLTSSFYHYITPLSNLAIRNYLNEFLEKSDVLGYFEKTLINFFKIRLINESTFIYLDRNNFINQFYKSKLLNNIPNDDQHVDELKKLYDFIENKINAYYTSSSKQKLLTNSNDFNDLSLSSIKNANIQQILFFFADVINEMSATNKNLKDKKNKIIEHIRKRRFNGLDLVNMGEVKIAKEIVNKLNIKKMINSIKKLCKNVIQYDKWNTFHKYFMDEHSFNCLCGTTLKHIKNPNKKCLFCDLLCYEAGYLCKDKECKENCCLCIPCYEISDEETQTQDDTMDVTPNDEDDDDDADQKDKNKDNENDKQDENEENENDKQDRNEDNDDDSSSEYENSSDNDMTLQSSDFEDGDENWTPYYIKKKKKKN